MVFHLKITLYTVSPDRQAVEEQISWQHHKLHGYLWHY